LNLTEIAQDSWSSKWSTQERFKQVENLAIDQSKGDAIVGSSRIFTYHVLTCLLHANMSTVILTCTSIFWMKWIKSTIFFLSLDTKVIGQHMKVTSQSQSNRKSCKGSPKSSRIGTEIDIKKQVRPKPCSYYQIQGHSRNHCPNIFGLQSSTSHQWLSCSFPIFHQHQKNQ